MRSHGVLEIAAAPLRSLSVAATIARRTFSRGAVHERQIRSAFVQFCLRHGSGNESGICAMIGRAHKSATCADSTTTLELPIMPTAKQTNNLRLKAIFITLTHQSGATLFVTQSIPGAGFGISRAINATRSQRTTKASELVMATGFPALITRALCWKPWSGLVRDDNARPDTTMPATSAATTILRWVDRSAL
jgi:hypothetical protein